MAATSLALCTTNKLNRILIHDLTEALHTFHITHLHGVKNNLLTQDPRNVIATQDTVAFAALIIIVLIRLIVFNTALFVQLLRIRAEQCPDLLHCEPMTALLLHNAKPKLSIIQRLPEPACETDIVKVVLNVEKEGLGNGTEATLRLRKVRSFLDAAQLSDEHTSHCVHLGLILRLVDFSPLEFPEKRLRGTNLVSHPPQRFQEGDLLLKTADFLRACRCLKRQDTLSRISRGRPLHEGSLILKRNLLGTERLRNRLRKDWNVLIKCVEMAAIRLKDLKHLRHSLFHGNP